MSEWMALIGVELGMTFVEQGLRFVNFGLEVEDNRLGSQGGIEQEVEERSVAQTECWKTAVEVEDKNVVLDVFSTSVHRLK